MLKFPSGQTADHGAFLQICTLQGNETLCGDREGCIWYDALLQTLKLPLSQVALANVQVPDGISEGICP